MFKNFQRALLNAQVVFVVGLLGGASSAHAAGNDFGTIAQNITESVEELPGLVGALAYLMGIMLGVLGILKLKDHVENPTQTPLKDGAVRLASGGALFALPIVFESMGNTIGLNSAGVSPAVLSRVEFGVR